MWIAFTLRKWDLVPNCGSMGTVWDVFAFVADFPVCVGFPGQVMKFGSICPLLAVNETT
jgi:hypothetical protein